MNAIRRKLKNTTASIKLIESLSEALDEKRFDVVIAGASAQLDDPQLSEDEKARFLFFKAVAQDMSGDPISALHSFVALKKLAPANPDFERSLRIVIQSLNNSAATLFNKDPETPALEEIYQLCTQHHYAVWKLTAATSRILAKTGKHAEAKARIMALLQLSPNDVDYLRSGLEIATLNDDQNWLRTLVAHVQELIEKRPYHFELIELLPEFEEGHSPTQRSS